MHAIVLASHSGFALNVLRSLTGIVTGVSVVGEISLLWRIAHRDKFIPANLRDDSEANVLSLAREVNKIAAVHAESVAIPADTIACSVLLAAGPFLDCAIYPSPTRALLDAYEDKWLFYELCNKHDIPTPKTILIGKKDSRAFREFTQIIPPPILIKPTNRMGTEGVVVIANEEDYYQKILHNDRYQYSSLIAQNFIPGRDIDISILAMQGDIVCSAIQIKIGNSVRFVENRRLFAIVEQLVKRTEYTGLCHFDAREYCEDGSVWIVDANPRFWGSLDAARWCGMNFTAAGLALALKRPTHEPATLIGGCYPGLAAALTSLFLGRLSSAELAQQQRVFLIRILSDPLEYAIGLENIIKRFSMPIFDSFQRAGKRLRSRLRDPLPDRPS